MANGLGYALGEGAEAASGAFHQTLNYKVALGLQQLRVGMEKEKLAMDRDRQALQMEQIQQAIDLGKIEEQEARADLKAKLREERLIRRGEHFISQAKSLEKLRGQETPSGKPSVFAEAIPEISAGRKLEAYDLAGREAPLAIKNLAEEEAMTPFDKKLRDAELGALEALGTSRQATSLSRLKEDVPDVPWDQQTPKSKMAIAKIYANLSFTNTELKAEYPSAQSWFDGDIRGVQPAPSQVAPGSDAQELKGLGYTLDHLNDPEYAKALQAMGYDVESAKANWNAE